MRLRFAAAVLAASLAAPAAAQPEPEPVLRGMVERLAANHAGVQEYTLVLVADSVELPVYVFQAAGGWMVDFTDDLVGAFLSAAMPWIQMAPASADPVDDRVQAGAGVIQGAEYRGAETVSGRRAHVLAGDYVGYDEMLDSVRLYVDAGTGQLLRMTARGGPREDPGGTFGERVSMQSFLELDDYRDFGGITLPSRLRLRVTLQAQTAPKSLRELRHQVRRQLAGRDEQPVSPQRRTGLELISRMLQGQEVELAMRVRAVHVNAGPPEWAREP